MKTTGAVLREGSVPGCEGLTCQSPNEGHSTAHTHLGRPPPTLGHIPLHTDPGVNTDTYFSYHCPQLLGSFTKVT